MDITKFFNSKNRNLSNNTNTEVAIVTDSWKTWGCFWIKFQVARLYQNFVKLCEKSRKRSKRHPQVGTFNGSNQIKGKKRLADFTVLIKLSSNKFGEFEKERQKQKKLIEEIRDKRFILNEKLDCITEQVDGQEQYSTQNWLLIHGITKRVRKTSMLWLLNFSRKKERLI